MLPFCNVVQNCLKTNRKDSCIKCKDSSATLNDIIIITIIILK